MHTIGVKIIHAVEINTYEHNMMVMTLIMEMIQFAGGTTSASEP